jgi:hypothetical protein
MYELFKTQRGYFFTDFFWLLFILAACFMQKELLMMGKNLDTTQFLLVQDCMWFKQNVVDTMFNTFGVIIVELVLLITIFTNPNITSLIYFFILCKLI